MSNVLADLRAAVVGLLDAGVDTFFDGVVPSPTPPPPYVLAYIYTEFPPGLDGNTLDGVSATITTYIICHCVGRDATASTAMAWQVRNALLDVTPTVTGRTCGQIYHDASLPPRRDETAGPLVMDQVVTYRFNSYPA